MKKIIIVLLILISLVGCGSFNSEPKTIREIIVYDETFKASELECLMGGGDIAYINNEDKTAEILNDLLNIRVDVSRKKKHLHIDDGNINFYFKNGPTIYFCTTEYLRIDDYYVKVLDINKLNNILRDIRNYEIMEGILGEIDLEIIDNGCEAKNVLVVKYKDSILNIEGVYEIDSKEMIDDRLFIYCKTGDYYNHENDVVYIISIENEELILNEERKK